MRPETSFRGPPAGTGPLDADGDGRKDFADMVLYFNPMPWIGANEPVSALDYNRNGRIDFADIIGLLNHF